MKKIERVSKDNLVQLFIDLVKIDSESGREAKTVDFLSKYLKNLGIETEKDHHGNLIARLAGQGKPLLLAAHVDTVKPGKGINPIIKGDRITSDGSTILGADDKAGVAEIISVLAYLKKEGISHRPIEAVFTLGEEIGLVGAKNLDYKKITAKEGLVFDRSGAVNTVVIASPYVTNIFVEIIGRSAHAGSPEKGINSLTVAIKALNKIKVGRLDSETTCNAIILEGGIVRNAIPGKVLIEFNLRSHVEQKLNKQIENIKKNFSSESAKAKTKVKITIFSACVGYKYQKNDDLVKRAIASWKDLKVEAILEKAGGASDANELVRRGIKVIDVGYGGRNPHTTHEEIKIKDMVLATEFLLNFLSK